MRYQAIYTPDAGTGIDMHIAVKIINTIMIFIGMAANRLD